MDDPINTLTCPYRSANTAVTGMKAAKNSTPINWIGRTSARAIPIPVVAHPRAKTVIR